MNKLTRSSVSQTVSGTIALAFGAAVAAGSPIWPNRTEGQYHLPSNVESYSSFRRAILPFGTNVGQTGFDSQIAEIYALIAADQKPLDSEIALIWEANLENLYET